MKDEVKDFKQREIGRIFTKIIKEGDEVTFVMGTGKNRKEFTRTALKITNKTVLFQFDESYPCFTSKKSPTGKKRINVRKIRKVSVKANSGRNLEFTAEQIEYFRF